MPKDERTVIACHDIGNGHWQVDTQLADGSVHLHAFPLEALEWRAAEYNIPLEDVDQLLDIVLHERLVTEGPPTLEEAPDADAARLLHLSRIEAVKAGVMQVRVPAARGKELEVFAALKSAHRRLASEEGVATKAGLVSQARNAARRQSRPLEQVFTPMGSV
jgi:hypothetical protein